jgi:hypothetical protein
MFMDNLYFHTIDVHVSVCINDYMALHTSDNSAKKKKKSKDKQYNTFQFPINLLLLNLAVYNLSTL